MPAYIPEGTVRIGKQGVGALARDLFKAPRLHLLGFDSKTKKMRFKLNQKTGIKVYKSAPQSKSGTFSVLSVLKLFGLEEMIGHFYPAELSGDELTIDFGRRLNGTSKRSRSEK